MNRSEIRESLDRVDELAREVELHVPAGRAELIDFRSDVAGLLVVLTCATYETCVKQIIFEYAKRHSALFGIYAENRYEKINSKIDVADLKNYSKTFHPRLGDTFKNRLDCVRKHFLSRTNTDIVENYNQLLRWRHAFAHSGARVTTVEEVIRHHRYAKRVLYIFSDVFYDFAV